MATYETGTATGLADLLTKLSAFATTNGWTVSTPSYALSGTYSRNGSSGIVTVSGLTSHKFVVGETVAANITSGSATSGNFVVLSVSSSSISYQDLLGATSGNATITSTHGRIYSKGGMYFGVGYLGTDFVVSGATGYSASAHWLGQAGASSGQPRANEMSGSFQAYHFFTGTSPDYLHAVVETTAGIFKHFNIGSLIKSGSFTGGEYACACYWHMTIVAANITPNHPDTAYHSAPFDTNALSTPTGYRSIVRADIDGKSNNWMDIRTVDTWNGNYAKGVVRGVNRSLLESLIERSPSEFNQVTPLLPMLICADRPSSMTSPLGYVPDMRYINMSNIAPGEVLTIGTDEWVCFPLIQKTATWNNASSSIPSSGTHGLAYKRN